MVAQFRGGLPDAEIVVFDNNSTDGTGDDRAAGWGSESSMSPNRARATPSGPPSRRLSEFDVIVLTDGDGTYPAEAAPLLVAPVARGSADMTVGARQPTPGAGAMTLAPGARETADPRGLPHPDRAGEHRSPLGLPRLQPTLSATTVQLRSSGFEIETELASEAVARGSRVVEIPIALPSADRRHPEQAAGLPRRPADPLDDRHAEPAAPPLSTAAGDPLASLGARGDGPLDFRGDDHRAVGTTSRSRPVSIP